MQLGSKASVLIVEDHSIIRWAIRSYLAEQGMETVGEASTISEAVNLAAALEPDIVLMDLLLGNESGIEATKTLSKGEKTRVLAFSAYDSPDYVEAFFKAGGAGFVSKASPVRELVTAIRATLDNRRWISPGISRDDQRDPKVDSILSSREQEVAALIAKGLSSGQIAEKLFVSLNTVETHRYRIFKKLGIHNRADLVDYAMRQGLLDARSATIFASGPPNQS